MYGKSFGSGGVEVSGYYVIGKCRRLINISFGIKTLMYATAFDME